MLYYGLGTNKNSLYISLNSEGMYNIENILL